jgi:hypothetical protein
MNTTLELRKVKIVSSMSRETIAYTGELWVNGKLTATLFNDGGGGSDEINTIYLNGPEEHRASIKRLQEAEEYCRTLPDHLSPKNEAGGYGYALKMTLDLWINLEVGKISDEQELKKFRKKRDKAMLNAIVIGNDQQYRVLQWPSTTIEMLLMTDSGRHALLQAIKKAKASLKDDERILNTNLPAEYLQD